MKLSKFKFTACACFASRWQYRILSSLDGDVVFYFHVVSRAGIHRLNVWFRFLMIKFNLRFIYSSMLNFKSIQLSVI